MSEFNEIITSRQNKYISELCSLSNRKARDKTGLFRFDGVKLLCEALLHGVEIRYIVLNGDCAERILCRVMELCGRDLLQENFRIIYAAGELFDKISEEKSPEGVICVAKYIDNLHFKIYNKEDVNNRSGDNVLLLESVRDPQNVGAIIRCAAAMGTDRIIMSEDCADIYNSKTVRASMGTLFGMRILRTDDLVGAVRALQDEGRRIYAAALDRDAVRLGEIEFRPGDCAVIGNEGHGLSQTLIDACDGCVYIPMAESVESLNASSAATVILWEFFGRHGH